MTYLRPALIACFFSTVTLVTAQASDRIAVYIELASPEPTVVSAHKSGGTLDKSLHRSKIELAQNDLLANLTKDGVNYELTTSKVQSGQKQLDRPDRFSNLINAVRVLVSPSDINKLQRINNVKYITVEEPMRLQLDNSVAYIRGNGPAPSARALGITGAGSMNTDGSANGQVIAVLDTGIDHTNPMYDSTTPDGSRDATSNDSRPVRLSGQPYVDGTNHPKVAYRYVFGQAPFEGDDTGHGTNSSTTAGGLLATDSLGTGAAVEGVAPGAVMMDYKVCPSLSCVNAQALMALEDCIEPLDIAGNPKPVCTVVNMSFGSDAGNPNTAHAVAAGNLQFAGVVPVASAGNAGPPEQIVGSPSSNRRVISVAASIDPGVAPNSLEILSFDQDLFDNPGNDPDPIDLPIEPGEPNYLTFFAPDSNGMQPLTEPVAQHYVYCDVCDTPDLVPANANGRICLSVRGSTQDDPTGTAGSGLFSNKAAQCAAKGGIALVMYNNVPGHVGAILAPAAIPVFTMEGDGGLYLRDTIGFDGNGISNLPIRLNLADPVLFEASTTGFSSRGPRPDFADAVKPDIIAPGQDILMGASKIGALGHPSGFIPASGTSFSGPHVAGSAALLRDSLARPDFTPSQVRAALMNSATNLRDGSGNEIADGDNRNFIHEVGAGLVDMIDAIQIGALMGTNETNGLNGPDDSTDPNFLPSYNFGQRGWINTGVPANDPTQQAEITVTVHDVGGGGGQFDLSIVDASGFPRGDVTRPITEPGFSVSLEPTQITVPPGGFTTFKVKATAVGTPAGLQVAGTDVSGNQATEFLWYVKADHASETLRMPFYLRAVPGTAPGLLAVDDLAFTDPDTAVDVNVLQNDQGAGISISSAENPANGTAIINDNGTPGNPADDVITYIPDAGFIGTDAFDYGITDGAAFDFATVTVNVGQCAPTGSFNDNLEGTDPGDDPSGHEPGWTFATPVNDQPASVTWTVTADPLLGHSPTNSFFSDGSQASTLNKDDRVISPAFAIPPGSKLTWSHNHWFDVGNTSGNIDGGVLEVCDTSTNCAFDGNWQDIIDAGGVFDFGGYNGAVSSTGDSPIAGRSAYVSFSPFFDAHVPVSVDLSAFATKTVQFRWRLVLDNVIVAGSTATGWFVDDIVVTATGCNLAPIAVNDEDQTNVDTPITIAVLANDSDPDGDPIEIDLATDPPNGTVAVNDNDPGPDTITYTPDPGFSGPDSFGYAISDPDGASDTASVTVTVVGTDFDGDGIPDDIDNCPVTANSDQADLDSDGVGNVCDNCSEEFNPDQCNTNAPVASARNLGLGVDNFGNKCDADLDNNGIVNSFDLTLMRQQFGQSSGGAEPNNDADLDCNGIVNSFDLTIMRQKFGGAPGPSGIQ